MDCLLQAVSRAYDGKLQMIDASSIRVHQHAANGTKSHTIRCMGHSRGGLTTKIHAPVDAGGLPILLKITAGQAMTDSAPPTCWASLGRGDVLLADRGYDPMRWGKSLPPAAPKPMSG